MLNRLNLGVVRVRLMTKLEADCNYLSRKNMIQSSHYIFLCIALSKFYCISHWLEKCIYLSVHLYFIIWGGAVYINYLEMFNTCSRRCTCMHI